MPAGHDDERNFHTLTVLHTFVMVLDVFSDFLVTEQKTVLPEWAEQLHRLGAALEHNAKLLQAAVRKAYGDAPEA